MGFLCGSGKISGSSASRRGGCRKLPTVNHGLEADGPPSDIAMPIILLTLPHHVGILSSYIITRRRLNLPHKALPCTVPPVLKKRSLGG
ncbi:unnamed protein product [Gulo gulo]|uniref:Uncharacterized protein n=1 Tax=Gulo gulo TaxID=48420 RepID=A0A9X9LV57_GULGU|nr:unnamed protein product [Gulo gulo]